MNYLASYKHSGNTLLRYFIEVITNNPTIGHNISSISDRFIDSFVDKSIEPILIKRHQFDHNELKSNDKLILIIRDYKDCIKHDFISEFDNYLKLLQVYKRHKGLKIIINYIDIINDILSVCKKVLDFIEYKGKTNFDLDIEYHKNKCLSVYRNKTGLSGYSGFFMEKIPAVQFTFDLWKAGSLNELGIFNKYYSIFDNTLKIREHAIGYNFADRLYVRPKNDCMSVMFFNNEHFWTHLTKKEFILCFPELRDYLKY